MAFSWLKNILSGSAGHSVAAPAKNRFRPSLERLEDRLVPVTGVTDLTTLTPQALVNSLLGPNSSTLAVSNIKYTGAAVAAGTFVGGANSIGIDTGVVLSSGSAKGVVGPNNTPSFSTSNSQPGDAQLDLLAAPFPTHDASILEFDFVPKGNVLFFNYVFGSEEYPEFVNLSFNDVFAFYINGQNVALVPGTNTPVTIDTINAGLNSQFYIDNTAGTSSTQMDAFTTVLPIVVPVQQGATNHIKLAIADASDFIYDSWVLLGGLASGRIDTYRPLRYVYDAATQTFDGNVTVVNHFATDKLGPNFVVFPSFPDDVTLANPDGVTGAGDPYIALPNGGTLVHQKPSRVFIKLQNPKYVYLSSFFIAYPVEVVTDVS